MRGHPLLRGPETPWANILPGPAVMLYGLGAVGLARANILPGPAVDFTAVFVKWAGIGLRSCPGRKYRMVIPMGQFDHMEVRLHNLGALPTHKCR